MSNATHVVVGVMAMLAAAVRAVPCWTFAGSAVRWCGSTSGPDPPSEPASCSCAAAAGPLYPAALLAVWGDRGGRVGV